MGAVAVGQSIKHESEHAMASVPWTYRDMLKAIGVFLAGSIAAGGVALGVASLLVESGQDYEDNAAALTALLIASFVVQELLLLGTAWWFAVRKYHLSFTHLGVRPLGKVPRSFSVGLAAAALIVIYAYVGLMALAGVNEPQPPSQTFDVGVPFIILVIGAIGMAPFIEEIFFRGFLFAGIARKHGWVFSAAVSGLIFAVGHASPFVVIPFTGVGFLFAWSYWYTGSLKSSMIAHFIVNVVSVSLGFATAAPIWI